MKLVNQIRFTFKIVFQFFKYGNWISNKRLLETCDVLFVARDVNKNIELEGKAFSSILDTLREEFEILGRRCESLSLPLSGIFGKKTFKDDRCINRDFLFESLRKSIDRRLKVPVKDQESGVFKRVLRIAKPKLVIGINIPSDLCSVAKRRGIFCVEVLHAHGYVRCFSHALEKRLDRNLPAAVIAFDKISHQSFSKILRRRAAVIMMPDPFLRRWEGASNLSLPSEWKYKFQVRTGVKKVIVLTLSYGNLLRNGAKMSVSDLYEELGISKIVYDLMCKERKFFWQVRVHPVVLKSVSLGKVRKFLNTLASDLGNIEWEKSSRFPMPAVAENSDVHITMESMAAYEAAYCGLKTIFLASSFQSRSDGYEKFDDLVTEGYGVKGITSYESIHESVAGARKLRRRISVLRDQHLWFKALDDLKL